VLHFREPSYEVLLQITWKDLKAAEQAVGEFGGDNRAGVQVQSIANSFATIV